MPVVIEAPAPVPAPTPAVQASPLPVVVAAQAVNAGMLSGVTPTLPSLSVGGLNYTAVGDAGATPTSAPGAAAGGERLPATQGLGAGRDVKFLSVFVVSGGIQMPPAAVGANATASAPDAAK